MDQTVSRKGADATTVVPSRIEMDLTKHEGGWKVSAVADLRRQHQQRRSCRVRPHPQTFGVVGYTVLRSDLVTPAGGSMMAKLAVATVASLPEGSSVTVMSMTADRRPLCTTRAVPRAKPSRTPRMADVHIGVTTGLRPVGLPITARPATVSTGVAMNPPEWHRRDW